MKYLLLIYTNEQLEQTMSPEELEQMYGDYFSFTNAIREDGSYVHGEALQPTTAATTVSVRDGETVTTDGPYAETKEHLGGFYLVDAADLDQAIQAAARIPGARHGFIEVRPVLDTSQVG